MKTFTLRNGAGVELAADGATPVERRTTLERGLLVIGRKLLTEREADRRAGRAHRKLNMGELRALNAAQGDAR